MTRIMYLSGPVDPQFIAARKRFSAKVGFILSPQWMARPCQNDKNSQKSMPMVDKAVAKKEYPS
jgi:hypothetical protein